ncbi:MAG: permease [bacterium]|nr:permease [bacterium]
MNVCNHCGKELGGQFNYGGHTRAATPAEKVEQATSVHRAEFIRKTYTHLAVAVLAFIILESILLKWSGAQRLAASMLDGYNWLIVLGVFMLVSYIADKWARSSTSRNMQYAGLALYVAAEAFIFIPILFIAKVRLGTQVIGTAGMVTLGLFAGLTYIVFSTRKDFSFLRNILGIGGFIAMGAIVAGVLFGFTLGLFFSFLMVAFASGAILYQTSNIIHHYRTDQYVAASLSLFASVMLLFWYILRIFLAFDD